MKKVSGYHSRSPFSVMKYDYLGKFRQVIKNKGLNMLKTNNRYLYCIKINHIILKL